LTERRSVRYAASCRKLGFLLNTDDVNWEDEDEHALAVQRFFKVVSGMAQGTTDRSMTDYSG